MIRLPILSASDREHGSVEAVFKKIIFWKEGFLFDPLGPVNNFV